MATTIYELTPVHDNRKSFYGKAHVIVNTDNHTTTLKSYDSIVARVDHSNASAVVVGRWADSATTLRHVKEFLKQQGFPVGTKAQLTERYTA